MLKRFVRFVQSSSRPSQLLLTQGFIHDLSALQLFAFGDEHRGKYDDSIGAAVKSFYPSVSGYADELLWAALWLHRATGREEYLDYVIRNADELNGTTWAISEFSWDIKYAGLQILASKVDFSSSF